MKVQQWPKWVWFVLLLVLVLLASLAWHWQRSRNATAPDAGIVLLLPDAEASRKYVLTWQDAAAESGVPMTPMRAADFVALDAAQRAQIRGVVLPDSIHRHVTSALGGVLEEYVRQGGALWLNYDAATENADGRFLDRAELTRLVGVDYLLFRERGKGMIHNDMLLVPPSTITDLTIAPGRFQPYTASGNGWLQATTYGYDNAAFSYFETRGSFPGKLMAEGRDGSVLAGLRDYGKGKVLFVNLPVGYLAVRTDGLWLHSFMAFFNGQVLHLPRLSAVPDGIGGLVMNWHVDAANALPYIDMLEKVGFLKQGPYSIHFTTGPDTNRPGDHMGMDLANNPKAQALVSRLKGMGNEIGAHGGWAHNYFAFNINEHNGAEWTPYLEHNKQDLENVIHQPLTEYSAPNGNQPGWVTDWLRKHGVIAYYQVANLSMGPTRSFIDPSDMHGRPWSFPVSADGAVASFEEGVRNNYGQPRMQAWLQAMTRFVVDQGEARLVYFHPPGVYFYQDAAAQWLAQTAALRSSGKFRWYTMSGLARFLSQRELTTWKTRPLAGARDGRLRIQANNPQSLADQSWLLPKAGVSGKPQVTAGAARIEETATDWRITAQSGKDLQIDYLPTTSISQ